MFVSQSAKQPIAEINYTDNMLTSVLDDMFCKCASSTSTSSRSSSGVDALRMDSMATFSWTIRLNALARSKNRGEVSK